MLVEGQWIKIKVNNKNKEWYKEKGYSLPKEHNGEFLVRAEDLSPYSEKKVLVKCDYCGKIYELNYHMYTKAINNTYVQRIACRGCTYKKIKECNLLKYGVENTMSVPEIHAKQSDSKRRSIESVRDMFVKNNFTPKFKDEDYRNGQDKLKCICNNHPNILQYKTYDGFVDGDGCFYCYFERNRGENHPNWKGGITNLNYYLRNKLKPWLNASKKRSNVCFVTGEVGNVYHHIYPFRDILSETLESLKYDNREYYQISDFTTKELNAIKDKCLELHFKYGLGVCLKEEIHNLFHHIYGFEDLSMHELEEFKERYNKGEFRDVDLSEYKYFKEKKIN